MLSFLVSALASPQHPSQLGQQANRLSSSPSSTYYARCNIQSTSSLLRTNPFQLKAGKLEVSLLKCISTVQKIDDKKHPLVKWHVRCTTAFTASLLFFLFRARESNEVFSHFTLLLLLSLFCLAAIMLSSCAKVKQPRLATLVFLCVR